MRVHPKSSLQRTAARWLFAGVMLAAAGWGGWIFFGKKQATIPSAASPLSTEPMRREQVEPSSADDPFTADSREQMLSLLRQKLDASGAAELLSVLAEIARTEPALAIELAHALGRSDKEKSLWVTDLTSQWAERDPQTAWEWLTQLSSERLDQFANGSLPGVVIDGMAARAPQRLISMMDTLVRADRFTDGIAPAVAVHLGLQALIKSGDVSLAQTIVEDWGRDPLKPNIGRSAYEAVALALGRNNPAEAGSWLRSLPSSEERNAAIATFASDWGDRDPIAALRWAETLPPQDGQRVALERTFSAWVERDTVGAAEWLSDHLSRLPAGAKSDRLIGSLLAFSPTLKNTPEVAKQWTELISDPEQRASYEEQTAWRWSRHDLAAATQYVWNSSSMAWQQKQALLQKLRSAPATGSLEE